jgi:hypothetical protein
MGSLPRRIDEVCMQGVVRDGTSGWYCGCIANSHLVDLEDPYCYVKLAIKTTPPQDLRQRSIALTRMHYRGATCRCCPALTVQPMAAYWAGPWPLRWMGGASFLADTDLTPGVGADAGLPAPDVLERGVETDVGRRMQRPTSFRPVTHDSAVVITRALRIRD